ncbi:MAG: LysR substrate-binding domain-containing protein, partial [Halanaerobium sp.]|nr:LysR substrate-binding domain-containing protein [Halanaerobium sp.]
YILPGILGEFQKSYPPVQIRMQITNSNQVIEDILNNKIELGIIGGRGEYPPAIKARTFFQDRLVVITPPSFPAKGPRISPGQLEGQEFIIREKGSNTGKYTRDLLKQVGSSESPGLELTTPEAIKEAVQAGLGISLISSQAVKKEVSLGTLKAYLLEGFNAFRPLDLIWHKDKHLNQLITAFLQYIEKYQP